MTPGRCAVCGRRIAARAVRCRKHNAEYESQRALTATELADEELLAEIAIMGKGSGNRLAARWGVSRVAAYKRIRDARERNGKRDARARHLRRSEAARRGWATRRARREAA